MAYIVSIETATPVCSVALSIDNEIIGLKETDVKNSHAEVVTVFIDELLQENKIKTSQITAVAVSKGPGSYTGLRIGVSTAKGLCYAFNIPMIAIGTLTSMAFGMAGKMATDYDSSTLFCPMLDARRMEVYCSLYDYSNKEVLETSAKIIDKNSFSDYLNQGKIIFFGNGAAKCRNVLNHPNAFFVDDFNPSAKDLAGIAYSYFQNKQFENVAYFEPFYLKDFIAGMPRVKGLK
ncbi:MAG: tRNA (adenosine(37)-N6)-threonylcarbamoyltransferase complex dimerization subunit type 1 TsaB [Bacteroidales bacterium]